MSKTDLLALTLDEHVAYERRTRHLGFNDALDVACAIRELAAQEGHSVWLADDEDRDLQLTAGDSRGRHDRLLALSFDEHVDHVMRVERVRFERAIDIVCAVRELAAQEGVRA